MDHGPRVEDGLEGRIAARLAEHRRRLGWSLGELADCSGVSKSMIARIERCEASPTAGLLGRLCAGLGITLSALITSVESVDVVHRPRESQPIWRDDEVGLERRTIAAPLHAGGVDLTRVTLPAGAEVGYDVEPRVAFVQYLLVLAGKLEWTLGEYRLVLSDGDCVGALVDRPTRFRCVGEDGVDYLVIADRGSGVIADGGSGVGADRSGR